MPDIALGIVDTAVNKIYQNICLYDIDILVEETEIRKPHHGVTHSYFKGPVQGQAV